MEVEGAARAQQNLGSKEKCAGRLSCVLRKEEADSLKDLWERIHMVPRGKLKLERLLQTCRR
jgi:hypothetical protein